MSKKQQEKINKANPTLKNGNEQKMTTIKTKQYRKLRSFRFPRIFITALTALAITFAVVGTTACNVENNPNPGPGVVDPEQPNPDKPTPPDPDQPDKPDPDQPDKPDPDQPDKPDPDQPDKPDIDYDKLTPQTLTAEQKATIVKKVTTALAKNIQKDIGRAGYVNKVIAVDFDGNYVKLLLDFNGVNGDTYGLFKYEMTSDMTYKNILTTEIAPALDNTRGETLIQFSHTSNDTRVKEVMAKLNTGVDVEACDFTSIVNTSGTIVPGIGGTNRVTIHTINNCSITKIVTNAKSDANYTDPIGQGIINGELGKTYTEPTVESFELGEYALYNFNGLESEMGTTAKTATYVFTVDSKTVATIKNGKYYQEEQE